MLELGIQKWIFCASLCWAILLCICLQNNLWFRLKGLLWFINGSGWCQGCGLIFISYLNRYKYILTHELFNLRNNIRIINISKNWYFRNWNVIHRNPMFWFEICTIWTVIPVVNRKNWCESMPNIFRTENRLLQEWCEKRKYFWEY